MLFVRLTSKYSTFKKKKKRQATGEAIDQTHRYTNANKLQLMKTVTKTRDLKLVEPL